MTYDDCAAEILFNKLPSVCWAAAFLQSKSSDDSLFAGNLKSYLFEKHPQVKTRSRWINGLRREHLTRTNFPGITIYSFSRWKLDLNFVEITWELRYAIKRNVSRWNLSLTNELSFIVHLLSQTEFISDGGSQQLIRLWHWL